MLKEDSQGVVLKIRVKPRARRTAIVGVRNDALLVEVTAPPEQNRANDAVIALLAGIFDLPKSKVEILSGHSFREKLVRLCGVSASQCRERLGI
ncbi:MAG: DUF167 domain-containing protein [Candidatus Bipolaricaulia bacterium]